MADQTPAREFLRADLRGARFTESDLSGAVMRAVDVDGVEIDSPWLDEQGATLWVNDVDVVPFVEAELNRRFPGRRDRWAEDPAGLRGAWASVESTWAATVERVAALPAGTAEQSVAGEWSFAQTLRHLVMATDTWLGRTVLQLPEPYHPIGLPYDGYAEDGGDTSLFTTDAPPYDEVLVVRAGRMAQVREFLAELTPDLLLETRVHPWAPDRRVSVRKCLHVILHEEWEHHRFAVRDLGQLDQSSGPGIAG